MNHTPTAHDNLYTCPACAFRAVATGAGLIVTEEGDGRALHLAAIQAQQALGRAERARIVTRLREQYNERTPLPEADDNRDDLVAAGVTDARTLTLEQLRTLIRCVETEFAV